MKPSSFQATIENQFDYICKRAMEDERKDYFKQLSRLAKHEVSFVYRHRTSGLAMMKKFMEEFEE